MASSKAGAHAYIAAKRALVGLMQVLANEYASDMIRVNTIPEPGGRTVRARKPGYGLRARSCR
ncbi:SDR family oxidoreductase [Amycolatopsis mediterranei]|uniref:Short chain dehydrogenase n=1 Tax=Amycolatopsis mediterranei (strain S699) TaxID=713604 RepID=A0A9R0UCI2_AMYMS|nr:putative short chain dehydrogenase [Amycolatopsis mediterranei S699]UZF73884.1 SDR family oxidoreductase [Amycolatopsis mediterranei]